MADKSTNFVIKVDSKEVDLAKTSFVDFKKIIADAKKELQTLPVSDPRYKQLATDINSAEKAWKEATKAANKFGDENEKGEEQVKSYRLQIRETTIELQKVEQQFGKNSVQAVDLREKLKGLKDEQDNFNQTTVKLDDALGNIPGPIGKVGKAMQQYGFVTNNARTAVASLTKAFPILKNAIAATGIGALVILFGLLVGAVIKAFNSFKPLQDAVAKLGVLMDVLGQIVEPIIELIGKGLVVVLDVLARSIAFVTGKTEEFNKALADKKALEEFNANIEEQKFQLETLGDTYDEFEKRRIAAAIERDEKIKEINESEVLDAEEKVRRILLIEQRLQRNLIRIEEELSNKRKDQIKKANDERISLEKTYNEKILNLKIENSILEANSEFKVRMDQIDRETLARQKEINEIITDKKKRDEALLELEKNFNLKSEKLAEELVRNEIDFGLEILNIRAELSSDIENINKEQTNNESIQRAVSYTKEIFQLKKQYDEIINTRKAFGDEFKNVVENLEREKNETLTLLQERFERDSQKIIDKSELEIIQRQIKFFNQSISTLDRYAMSVETELLEIVSAYDGSTKAADIFLGKLSKRMSDEMMLNFQKTQDLREIYKDQYNLIADAIELENQLLNQSRLDNLISEEAYFARINELEAESLQNKQTYTQQKIGLDRLEVESRRESANASGRIAENLAALLSEVAGKSRALQIASALTEAAVSIARIITDTQRAIIAFTASVAPLGPAGVPIAAAYAVKSKVSAAIGIATISAGAISKLKGLNATTTESSGSTSGQQSNNLGRGYSEGGLVQGPGTTKSDSIPARLSNGEAVMTANAVSMFNPLLSMMNQMGGGVAFSSNFNTTFMDKPIVSTPSEQKGSMIMKTYVVEKDLTNSQQRQARLKDLSTL